MALPTHPHPGFCLKRRFLRKQYRKGRQGQKDEKFKMGQRCGTPLQGEGGSAQGALCQALFSGDFERFIGMGSRKGSEKK